MKRTLPAVAALVVVAAAWPGATAELTCPAPMASSCEKADVGFLPQYPDPGTMPKYAEFTATLPGLGFLGDGDDDGAVADERCNSSKEAGLGEGIAALATLVAVGTACNVAPENVDIGCFAVLTVLTTALESVSILHAQCGLQDGLVNGAEIEAAYENTRMLIASQLELTLQECTPLGTVVLPRSLGGRAEEVRALVRHRIDQLIALDATPRAVDAAEADLALGDSEFSAGEYTRAFRQLCKAYGHLQHARK
jgi:hypothetical protein